MRQKNFSILDATSKSATFSTDAVNMIQDWAVSFVVTTTSASSLNVSLQLEVSNDGTNWATEGSATAVTTNTSTGFACTECAYSYSRITATFTAGSATFQVQTQTKGQ